MPLGTNAAIARAELRRWPWGGESKMTGSGRGEKRFRSATRNPWLQYTEGGVMMESAPVTAFKMSQPQLLYSSR